MGEGVDRLSIVDILLVREVEGLGLWNTISVPRDTRRFKPIKSTDARIRDSLGFGAGGTACLEGWILALLNLEGILNHLELIFVLGVECKFDFIRAIATTELRRSRCRSFAVVVSLGQFVLTCKYLINMLLPDAHLEVEVLDDVRM